ncbi:MAG: hypothetical protein NTW85_16265 [Methylococcales bacterium]|nr:hypothetical protein [Methylococcales bacterium]
MSHLKRITQSRFIQEIDRDLPNNINVFRRITRADARIIFFEGNIENPMQGQSMPQCARAAWAKEATLVKIVM